jgi:ribulose-phosphate 3-epimerase
MRKKIAPSILSADFTRLGEEIAAVEKAGADYIHVDVMDGHFVPNITIGPMIVRAARRATGLPLDVHLMIEEPDRFIDEFVRAGADIVTVHAETAVHLHRSVEQIRKAGAKAGVSLNPATSTHVLDYILEDLDMVLLMTVNPGFEGQTFIESVLPKIEKMRAEAERLGLDLDLEVDGGIGPDTIRKASAAGANVFVAGSAVFYSDDYEATIRLMRSRL